VLDLMLRIKWPQEVLGLAFASPILGRVAMIV
jgi:hypothetical protein